MLPRDTDPRAWAVQLECFRRMTPERRIEIAIDLSVQLRATLREGIRSRHPQYTEEDLDLAVQRLLLGEELFAKAWRGRAGPPP